MKDENKLKIADLKLGDQIEYRVDNATPWERGTVVKIEERRFAYHYLIQKTVDIMLASGKEVLCCTQYMIDYGCLRRRVTAADIEARAVTSIADLVQSYNETIKENACLKKENARLEAEAKKDGEYPHREWYVTLCDTLGVPAGCGSQARVMEAIKHLKVGGDLPRVTNIDVLWDTQHAREFLANLGRKLQHDVIVGSATLWNLGDQLCAQRETIEAQKKAGQEQDAKIATLHKRIDEMKDVVKRAACETTAILNKI